MTTFSARSTKLRLASSWICAFGAPVAKPKSKSASVLIAGKELSPNLGDGLRVQAAV
jgi:hypothetical protein